MISFIFFPQAAEPSLYSYTLKMAYITLENHGVIALKAYLVCCSEDLNVSFFFFQAYSIRHIYFSLLVPEGLTKSDLNISKGGCTNTLFSYLIICCVHISYLMSLIQKWCRKCRQSTKKAHPWNHRTLKIMNYIPKCNDSHFNTIFITTWASYRKAQV